MNIDQSVVRDPLSTEKPCVSIITVVKNAKDTLEKTLESIFSQSYDNLEVIIIDGGSTDGSVDMIKKHASRIHYWCSESDRGISHAFNKGIAASSGMLVTIVNADDWLSPRQIEWAVSAMEQTHADVVYGDLNVYNSAGTPLFKRSQKEQYQKIKNKTFAQISHMTVVFRRSVYNQIGPFSEDYLYAMDCDWIWRVFNAGLTIYHDPRIVGNHRLGGISSKRLASALLEERHINMKNGYSWVMTTSYVVKTLIKQFTLNAIQKVIPEKFVFRLMQIYKPHWNQVEILEPQRPDPSYWTQR